MRTTRGRAKDQTLESFERELEAARAEEEAHTQALADLAKKTEEVQKRREALEQQKRQLEEEERVVKEHERRMHMSRRTESAERLSHKAWERMGEAGECVECAKHGNGCFRTVYDPKEPGTSNAQWFWIENVYYSRCQECKKRRRLCALKDDEEVEVTKVEEQSPPPPTPITAPARPTTPAQPTGKRKRRESSPARRKEKTKSNGQHTKSHLPTPSSLTDFVQGSSSKPSSSSAKESRGRKSGGKRKRIRELEGELAELHEKMADMSETQSQVLALVTRLAGSGLGTGSQVAQPQGRGRKSEGLEYTDGE